MKLTKLLPGLALAAGLSIAAAGAAVAQQNYPDRVIKLVVPAGAGGPTDVLARLVAERLQSALGQSTVVENRGGAGGVIGARAVATADPDGYTLLFANTATHATIPAISKRAGYDPVKNFEPVAKVMESYQVLVVNPELPVKTVAELIAYAKANPGKLNFGTAGIGNITHLSGELLKAKTGMNFETVHYKSGAESLNSILSGQVQFTVDNITAVRALVQDGRLRPLAITAPTRKPELPNVPTMIEAGVPDYVVTSFFGVVAPAGTPRPIIRKLNNVINEGLTSEQFKTSLTRLGAQAVPATPEQFKELITGETRKWTEIADRANIKID